MPHSLTIARTAWHPWCILDRQAGFGELPGILSASDPGAGVWTGGGPWSTIVSGCGAGPAAHGRLIGGHVRELIRTNDAVLVSAVGALLDGAGIHHMVLDQNMSVLEGSLGILPRRILVPDEDEGAARRLLQEAGLGHELRPDKA
jgi:hypothetical protein